MARNTSGKKSRQSDLLPDQPTHPKGFRLSKGDKQFWLGHQKAEAEAKARALDTAWQKIKLAGRKSWSHDEVQAALDFAGPAPIPISSTIAPSAPAIPAVPPQPLPSRIDTNHLGLHAALNLYDQNVQQGLLGQRTKQMTSWTVKSLKHHLPDIPLDEVKFEQLQNMRSIITARPLRRWGKHNKCTAKKIKVPTVKNWLLVLGDAFRYFRKSGRWQKPEGPESDELNALFCLTKDDQKRICPERDERKSLGKPKPTFTLDQPLWSRLGSGIRFWRNQRSSVSR